MLQLEHMLVTNRARSFYAVKESFLQCQKARFSNSIIQFPGFDDAEVRFWKAGPTRHAIEGVFLAKFWPRESTYSYLMSQTSVSASCWLSCDHTFRSVSNIGSVRPADNKWVTQYTGLFCILNSEGKVLTWKMTKGLSFEHVHNVLFTLNERIHERGQQVEEFYIDNCCSLRSKLQSIFGTQLKVYLDLFHAIQRISQKNTKKTSVPFYLPQITSTGFP